VKELISKIRERAVALIAQVTEGFSRLSEQEKIVALGALTVLSTFAFIGITYGLISATASAERQIAYKSEQLREIISMRETYRRSQDQNAAFRARLQRNDIRLVALVEDEAKKMGLEVSNITPHQDGEASPSGIKTQLVDLRATKMSADKLMSFLQKLEEQTNPVRVVKLKVNTRFDEKDLLDAELTVATYKAS
jgi:Type II secretion system (T2SS), protein M